MNVKPPKTESTKVYIRATRATAFVAVCATGCASARKQSTLRLPRRAMGLKLTLDASADESPPNLFCLHPPSTMTSYLRSWLMGSASSASGSGQKEEAAEDFTLNISPPHSEDGDEDGDEDDDSEDTETETRRDRDMPPPFPAPSSAQRLSSTADSSSRYSNPIPTILTDTDLMPPPPIPSKALRVPGVPSERFSNTSSMLALPPTTTRPPTNLSKPKSASKYREKVALAPGYGPLDWAALKASGTDLRVSRIFILN